MDNLAITVQILQILLVGYVYWFLTTSKFYIRRKSHGEYFYYSKNGWHEKPDAVGVIELAWLIETAYQYDLDRYAVYAMSEDDDFSEYYELMIDNPIYSFRKVIEDNEEENW